MRAHLDFCQMGRPNWRGHNYRPTIDMEAFQNHAADVSATDQEPVTDKASRPRRSGARRVAAASGDGITEKQINTLAQALDQLQPERRSTPRDVAMRLAGQVQGAVERGCSLEQVARQMTACGVMMSVATLRRALREAGGNSAAS